jgi:acetyltransferase-like isoleucine patch superfamily enzyme
MRLKDKFKFLGYLLKRSRQNIRIKADFYKLLRQNPTLNLEDNVQIKSIQNLILGKHVTIQSNSILHCGGMEWCDYQGEISLGDHVVIGPGCILYGAGGLSLGEYTHLGPGVKILSHSGDSRGLRLSGKTNLVLKPIIIGKGCWIGAGAIILEGTILGDYCSIGPNCVVKGEYKGDTVLVSPLPRRTINLRKKSSEKNRDNSDVTS